MKQSQQPDFNDADVRYFIYKTFAETTKPPTTSELATHLNTTIAKVEIAFERLADAHHIALTPGSHLIWMAHPFSGIPTNYIAGVNISAHSPHPHGA